MSNWWTSFQAFLEDGGSVSIGIALVLFVLGIVLGKLLSVGLKRLLASRMKPHQVMLMRRLAFYSIFFVFTASALIELGFDLSVLLGAAGILTVAVGFASQTSASNIISGLFLIGEKFFEIGEVIKIGETTGEVISIDLLSVKLRTFDNLFVRIPNENLIKSEITNLNRFPIRRIDILIGVAYKEDLNRVIEVLVSVAEANPLCLSEPVPMVQMQGFGSSSVDMKYTVWTKQDHWLDVKNQLYREVKEAFDANDIEIPFPHISVYAGSATDALPVSLQSESISAIEKKE